MTRLLSSIRSGGPVTGSPGRTGHTDTVTSGDDQQAALPVALVAATRISTVTVACVIAVALVAPAVWITAPWVPFALGLLIGIPHGALDHLVPWWTWWRRRDRDERGWRVLAGVLAVYVALGVGAFAAARAWPVPALLGFLLASVVHFGTGETAIHSLRRPSDHAGAARAIRGRAASTAVAAAFGASTVVLPLAAWPDQVRPVLLALAPGAAALLDTGWEPWALGVVATLDVAALALLAARRRGHDAAELGLLVALFVLVPPLPAFAVFFGAWHGLRHLARLAATDPASTRDLARGRFRRPVARMAAHAAPPTLGVLAVLALLWLAPGLFGLDLAGLAGDLTALGLALVFALTVPHLLVVAALDRHQLRRRAGTH